MECTLSWAQCIWSALSLEHSAYGVHSLLSTVHMECTLPRAQCLWSALSLEHSAYGVHSLLWIYNNAYGVHSPGHTGTPPNVKSAHTTHECFFCWYAGFTHTGIWGSDVRGAGAADSTAGGWAFTSARANDSTWDRQMTFLHEYVLYTCIYTHVAVFYLFCKYWPHKFFFREIQCWNCH